MNNLNSTKKLTFLFVRASKALFQPAALLIALAGASIAFGQTARERPLLTFKDAVGVDENIVVLMYNAKGSGWDWVVIVEPGKAQLSKGPHSSIDPRYARQIDPNSNEARERGGSYAFPPLPEGNYEVHYISWDGGNNRPIARMPLKVGKARGLPPSTMPTPIPVTPSPARDLTGLWRNPDKNETYRLRQIGTRLYWGVDAVPAKSFANIYYGDIAGNTVDGIWIDLPGSPYVGDGKIFLRIESDCRLVKTAEVNHYAAETWVRKDSPCDSRSGGTPPATSAGGLSGLWRNPGGEAVYRFRQVGSKLHWGVDAVPIRSFANTFEGDISGSTIEGAWLDLPGSPSLGGGRLSLRIESECRIVKMSEVNHYGAQVWVRKDSPCDAVGLQQRANTTGAKPNAKPKVEEIPDDAVAKQTNWSNPPVVVVKDPSGVFDKPPSGTSTSQSGSKPRVEEIPDDLPSKPPVNTSGNSGTAANTSRANSQPTQPPPPKTAKTPKPKSADGGFWGRLGTAINQAVTTNQQTSPAGQTGQTGGTVQGGAGCRGGSWGLGTPSPQAWKLGTPGDGIRIPVSHPTGVRTSLVRVFRAGTNQQETWGWNPDLANFCGLTYPLYVGTEGYFDVWLYENDRSTIAVAGPVRFQAYR